MEDAAASLGASTFTIFRRVVLPNILPAILSGVALAFARAVGEFGSVVLVSGNVPFKTEVASVYILGRIESGDSGGAAAVSVVLLGISLVVLLVIGAIRRRATRHEGYVSAEVRPARLPRRAAARAGRRRLLPRVRGRLLAGVACRDVARRRARAEAHARRDGDRRSGEHGVRSPLRACNRALSRARLRARACARRRAAPALAGRRRLLAVAALRPQRLARRAQRAVRDTRDRARDDFRLAPVRRARGRAGAAGDRDRAGAGGVDARRLRVRDLS